MLGNLSRTLLPVQSLASGLGYLIGILLIMKAIAKLKVIGDSRAQGGSHEKIFVPIAYILAGAGLIFLPSALQVISNTAFGTGNILQYVPNQNFNVYNSMGILIQTIGVIWFIRGCILLAHASEPGVDYGAKGLTFLIAGIFAINFQGTYAMVNYVMSGLLHITGLASTT